MESENQIINNFVEETNKRFTKVLFFIGSVEYRKDLLIVNMRPLAFGFYWFGLLMALGIYYIAGWNFFIIPSLILFSLGFFWTRYFFYIFLRLGLKKVKYKGLISLLNDQKTLEVVLYGTK